MAVTFTFTCSKLAHPLSPSPLLPPSLSLSTRLWATYSTVVLPYIALAMYALERHGSLTNNCTLRYQANICLDHWNHKYMSAPSSGPPCRHSVCLAHWLLQRSSCSSQPYNRAQTLHLMSMYKHSRNNPARAQAARGNNEYRKWGCLQRACSTLLISFSSIKSLPLLSPPR